MDWRTLDLQQPPRAADFTAAPSCPGPAIGGVSTPPSLLSGLRSRFSCRLAALLHDRRALAAVEFAILGPTFLLLLFAIFGVGLDGFYQVTLDDAVRNAARQIQIDGPGAQSATGFVNAVCAELGAMANNCTSTLTYNIQANALATGFAALSPVALPNTGKFGNSFFAGTAYGDNVNVLVQVAFPLPFKIPFFSTAITNTGTGSIVATTTVRAEPL